MSIGELVAAEPKVDPAFLSSPPSQWVAELGRWEELLADSTRVESAEALDRARLIREVVKIRKLSGDVAVAASRVEAFALRRLGQLGGRAIDDLPHSMRSSARFLAGLTPEGFAQMIESITAKASVSTLVSRLRTEQSVARERTDARERAINARWRQHHAFTTVSAVRDAVRALVHEVFVEGVPTTVAAGATRLLEVLNVTEEDSSSEAAEAVVAHALDTFPVFPYNEPNADLIGFAHVPPFIVIDSTEGWVRIPMHLATVAQLRWMAAYREERAEDMARCARSLASQASKCEQVCEANDLPSDTPLGDALALVSRR